MMRKLLTVAFAALSIAACVQSAEPDHWVATWAASVLQTNVPPPGAQNGGGRGGPQAVTSFRNQTVRMVVNTSIGGRSVRVQLSNRFGATPLKIGSAHIALRGEGSGIVPISDRMLTFGGSPSAVIPPGASMVTDAVDLNVPAVGDLVVSVFFPEDTGPPTMHATGLHTTYISPAGDFTGAATFEAESTRSSWYFLSSVDVLAPADAGLIVAFGDSITDGATSTNDTNADWPSGLARRLHEAGSNLAVVNQGISGNRVLGDGAGLSVLARFEQDVLSQPGVKYLIFMEAINDIGGAARPGGTPVTAEEIIAIYKQMTERAHLHGIKVIAATLTPFEGAGYYSETGEEIREAVNQWIRTNGMVDAVIDFDRVTRDPANSRRLRSDFTIRDYLHPNDAGYKAMADSIDLSIFDLQ